MIRVAARTLPQSASLTAPSRRGPFYFPSAKTHCLPMRPLKVGDAHISGVHRIEGHDPSPGFRLGTQEHKHVAPLVIPLMEGQFIPFVSRRKPDFSLPFR